MGTGTQLKSEQVLESIRQTQRSKEIVDVEMELTKIVVFVSGGTRYGFYGSDIREILPACAISWVPGLPPYLPGLINIRGDIESVIDLGHFLGGEATDCESRLIAMAVKGNFRSGILIDAVDDVMDIPVNTIKPPLATLTGAARDLVAGEIEHQGGLITLLDTGKLGGKGPVMSSSGGPAEAPVLNLLLFSVGCISFGVDLEQIDGMAEHTGEVAADLRWLHELPGFNDLTAPYLLPTVLSIKTEKHRSYRVIIDAMEEIVEVRWTAITPLPLLLESRLLAYGIWGILQQNGRIVLLVDFQRIAQNT